MKTRSLLVLLVLPALASCGGDQGATPDHPNGWPASITLGLVPAREANVLVETAGPLADALSQRLGIPVQHFVPQDYTGLIEAMGAGQADIGLIPPFGAMMARDRYGIETVLISVRKGSTVYRSQWMTTDRSLCGSDPVYDEKQQLLVCDGPVEGMRGKRVGFTDPSSTSGYLFPALQVMDAGLDPERDLNPIFLGSHDAAVIAVLSGDVDVAVSYEGAQNLILAEYPQIREKLIVFNHSPGIPNDGVTLRKELPDDLKVAIKTAFLEFAAEDAARPKEERVLWAIYEIDGFEEPPAGLFEPVERAYTQLRDKIKVN